MFWLRMRAVANKCSVKKFSTSSLQRGYKVVVAGASGGIGQPLCLLLKQNPLVCHLACYDVAKGTPGVALDVSHINTPSKVTGHEGCKSLAEALQDADVVVIPTGKPRKPGQTREDLFSTNATIVREIMTEVSCCAPHAIVAILTNPVNSMVPLASEIMKQRNVLDKSRIIGVTNLDSIRAATFVGELNCIDPRSINVPVIGGHAGATIIPVLSQSRPALRVTNKSAIEDLTKRIREAGTEVVKTKAGQGSATLSMAFAAAQFINAILRGLQGEINVIQCGYVKSDVTPAAYFANPLLLGQNGVERNLGFGNLDDYERTLLKTAIPILQKNIQYGEEYIYKNLSAAA